MYENLYARGNIYFVRCERYVKIGFAVDVGERIAKLQTGNPFELVLMTVLEDEPAIVERWLHEALDQYRRRGEWFKLHKRIEGLIELIRGGAKIKDPLHLRVLLNIPSAIRKARRIEEFRDGRRREGDRVRQAGRDETGSDSTQRADSARTAKGQQPRVSVDALRRPGRSHYESQSDLGFAGEEA
jgi:hypothetical protein